MAQEFLHKNKLAQEKREAARRARRLARALVLDADRTTLLQFAAELDKEAEVLERAVCKFSSSKFRPSVRIQDTPKRSD